MTLGDGLTPGQQIGMATSHAGKAAGLLAAAAEQDPIVIAREKIEAIVRDARATADEDTYDNADGTLRSIADELEAYL